MLPIEAIPWSSADVSELAHGWRLAAAEPVTVSEAEAVLREPAAAVPEEVAARLGPLRILAVSYISCGGDVEYISSDPPQGQSHSSLWLEQPEGIALFLALREANAHDTGFELLAAVADLAVPRLTDEEFAAWARLLASELREGAQGEIDEDTLELRNAADPGYTAAAFAATLAEYMHALWHDVETRTGPAYLEPRFLRRRFEFLQERFPPNPGYTLFRE